MCGVFLTIGKPNDSIIEELILGNAKRGDDGRQLLKNQKFTLGAQRLTINDTANNEFIFSTGNDKIHTVTSGEIYNYYELKKTLTSKGYRFKTTNDTEVVLYAYIEWGKNLFHHLKGMFSCLIVDEQNNLAIAGRDKFGMKPLYWTNQGGQLYFSTAAKPLSSLHDGKVSIPNLMEFCYRQYILPPRTIFKNVFTVSPGHLFQVDLDDFQMTEHIFWENADFYSSFRKIDEEEFEHRFFMAIARHSQSDFDIGLMLSGGVDSVALLAADRHNSITDTYFFNNSNDEKLVAAISEFANRYNTVIEPEKFSNNTFKKWLNAVDAQPPSDGINTHMITADSHNKVLFSGVGADELMNGYKILSNSFTKEDLSSKRKIVTKFLKRTQLFPDRLIQPVFDNMSISFSDFQENMITNYIDLIDMDVIGFEVIRLLLMKTYLSQRLLVDADTFSLTNNVEIRAPYLDDDLVKLIFQIPNEFFCADAGRWSKVPLKRLINKHLGAEYVKQEKLGFVMPYEIFLERINQHQVADNGSNLNGYQRWTFSAMTAWFKELNVDIIDIFNV
jgi:asparagine synthase (glutamine-hydrolysing)